MARVPTHRTAPAPADPGVHRASLVDARRWPAFWPRVSVALRPQRSHDFKTSPRDLLPQDRPYILRWVEYGREFGDLDDIAIVVEAPSLTEAKEYATRLVGELKTRGVSREAHRLSHRPQAVRGPGAALSLARAPARDPGQDLRQPGADGGLRRSGPPSTRWWQGISTQVASALRLGVSRPRPVRVQGAGRPALHPGPRRARSPSAWIAPPLPLAVRLPLLGARRR